MIESCLIVAELYVIYTDDRASHLKEISLSEEFFKERYSAVDVTVKILYGTVDPKRTDGEDIIGQYVLFTALP